MKSAGCSAAGSDQRKNEYEKRSPKKESVFIDEAEVPGRREAEIVVPIVIPVVVDVQAIRVEVADVHAVAVRVHAMLSASINGTES